MAELGGTGNITLSQVLPTSLERMTVPMRPGVLSPMVKKTVFGSSGRTIILRGYDHGNVWRICNDCQVAPSSVLVYTSLFTTTKTVLGGPSATATLWTSGLGMAPLMVFQVSPQSVL